MIADAYEAATYQEITAVKLEILHNLYEVTLSSYQSDRSLARQIKGDIKTKDLEEYAAMVVVTNSILNLDEVISKT